MLASEVIESLGLKPLPVEGGFYRETYRSDEMILSNTLPERYNINKCFCTAIYYLLTPETFSLLHRLPTDEIYHFYLGDPVVMLLLYPEGGSEIRILGPNIGKGEQVQVIVPKGTWQGLFLSENGRFGLMGTTMAPGFDFSDFEAGNRQALIEKYPERKDLIIKLT